MEFKELLQSEYLKRLKRNPKYSIRAYANFLDINSGSLSRLLNGQRGASEKTMRKIYLKLGLDYAEEEKTNSYQSKDLSLDLFKIISDWHHFAILELVKTNSFQWDAKWIASRLGISVVEANNAIDRLLAVEFLEVNDEGELSLQDINLSTLSKDYTTAALKKLQKVFLEKAISAQEDVSFEDRQQTTLTVAVNREMLPQVKEKLNGFRRELNQYCETMKDRDEVYNISLSLYPLTKLGDKK